MKVITKTNTLTKSMEVAYFPAEYPWWLYCMSEMQRTYMRKIDEIYVSPKYVNLLALKHELYFSYKHNEHTGKEDFKLCGMKLKRLRSQEHDLITCVSQGRNERKLIKHFRIKLIEDLNGTAFLHKSKNVTQ